jgi:hypothetical protein
MDKQKYIDDLKDIKDIMNRSSRFISLSGLSGISAGIIALVTAYLAYANVYAGQNYLVDRRVSVTPEMFYKLIGIGAAAIVLALFAGIFFTARKARANNEKIWDRHTQGLILNLAIPLVTGGLVCLMLLLRGYVGLVAPLTLVFYGLALVHMSKYTLSEIRSLGILEIILGLISFWYVGYGLIFWAIGFGVLHIVYGIYMYVRGDK